MVIRQSRALVAAVWLCTRLALAQESDAPRSDLDARLAREARMEWITQAAVARSPALGEAAARSRAALDRASEAERLPDLELKYEQWGVPLPRPYDLQRANMLMLGVRQTFPAPGTRQVRARMASEDANMASHQSRATQRDLLRRVRRAYFGYWAADRALAAHAEHVAIAEQTIAELRTTYAVGQGSQQTLLRAMVELSRLHAEVVETTRRRDTGRYLLNTLMGRDTDAPLGPPTLEPQVASVDMEASAKASRLAKERPEVAIAKSAVRRSQAAVEGAQHTARRPNFMAGLDYWLMPMQDAPHAYGAMVAMSLPWLNPAHRAEVRAAEASARADRSAAQAAEDVARYEVYEATAGLKAAAESLRIIEEQVMPQTEKSLQAARSAFAVGQGDVPGLLDAMRALYGARLEQIRASERVLSQLAELEFASGAPLFSGRVNAEAQR